MKILIPALSLVLFPFMTLSQGNINLISNGSFSASDVEANHEKLEGWTLSGMVNVDHCSFLYKNKLFHPTESKPNSFVFINAYKESTIYDSLVESRLGRMYQFLNSPLKDSHSYVFNVNLAFRNIGSTFNSDQLKIEFSKELNAPAVISRKMPHLIMNKGNWFSWTELIEPDDDVHFIRFGFLDPFENITQHRCDNCENMHNFLQHYRGKIEVVSFYADDMSLFEVSPIVDFELEEILSSNRDSKGLKRYMEGRKIETLFYTPRIDENTFWLENLEQVQLLRPKNVGVKCRTYASY